MTSSSFWSFLFTSVLSFRALEMRRATSQAALLSRATTKTTRSSAVSAGHAARLVVSSSPSAPHQLLARSFSTPRPVPVPEDKPTNSNHYNPKNMTKEEQALYYKQKAMNSPGFMQTVNQRYKALGAEDDIPATRALGVKETLRHVEREKRQLDTMSKAAGASSTPFSNVKPLSAAAQAEFRTARDAKGCLADLAAYDAAKDIKGVFYARQENMWLALRSKMADTERRFGLPASPAETMLILIADASRHPEYEKKLPAWDKPSTVEDDVNAVLYEMSKRSESFFQQKMDQVSTAAAAAAAAAATTATSTTSTASSGVGVTEGPGAASGNNGNGGGNDDGSSSSSSSSSSNGQWSFSRKAGVVVFSIGTVVLFYLGAWQLRRRNWKQCLHDFREHNLRRTPAGLGKALNTVSGLFGVNDTTAMLVKESRKSYKQEFGDALGRGKYHPSLDPAAMDQYLFSLGYLPVFAKGVLDYSRETLVGVQPPPMDPRNVNKRDVKLGYHIITPMTLDQPVTVELPKMVYKPEHMNDPDRPVSFTISTVLVNRGWVDREQVVTYLHNKVKEPSIEEREDGQVALTLATAGTAANVANAATNAAANAAAGASTASTSTSSSSSSSASSWWWPFGGSSQPPAPPSPSTTSPSPASAPSSEVVVKAPAPESTVVSGVAWMGISPPPTKNNKPVMHKLRSGALIFQFLDAISIADFQGYADASTVNYASSSSSSSTSSSPSSSNEQSSASTAWRPPVFVVDCMDPAPEPVLANSLDEASHKLINVKLHRKTEDDHKTFLTTPTTHAIYAATWLGLGTTMAYLNWRKFLTSGTAKKVAGFKATRPHLR